MERYINKVVRLESHLKEHPTDYQAVVALLKRKSDVIEHRIWLKTIERKKRLAEVKRRRKEREDAKEHNVE